ncbi:MAG: carboxypeptidase regulatory-like domain-containing protein [Candidatus Brockarchaeota archaeon]|nr:carboxypeptidase regulatory-like domain-containing protein [Candidatus Brockarchaeota archaeon]MBO3808790.1 carboxypeptidase regulatory-like domain-containing protein [Candidatus Brockarchaeota archaeon]
MRRALNSILVLLTIGMVTPVFSVASNIVGPPGVQPPVGSAILTLLTGLEYPRGLWVKDGRIWLTETAGRNTPYGGKVCLAQYDIATGRKTVLVDNPRACDAVAVASNYRIYLTSYVGSIPGERGVVTAVDPMTNIETLLLDVEIASNDMFIDENDNILIIGSSDQPGAKSIYLLPAGNYLNPVVLKTGLGRTNSISKHGEYVYFSDLVSIKRFRYPDGAVETFLEKSVKSMSFSSEHLYYANYRDGVVGRINIKTKVDEVLASGLNGPVAVRYDESTGELYFLEVGTSAGKYKDGTLKAIHLGPSLKKTGLTISLSPPEILEKESVTVTITGRLTDESGVGLGGRPIGIYRDGDAIGSVTTDSDGRYSYEWKNVYLERGDYEITVVFKGDFAHRASNTSIVLTVMAKYMVEVFSERGVATGSGWYRQGATATVSISPTVIEKDFLTKYVFEGWKVKGVIVSTSPTYSFTVDKTVTLVASWRTETNLVNVGIIVGIILLMIMVSAILVTRRKRAPLPPPPPPGF